MYEDDGILRDATGNLTAIRYLHCMGFGWRDPGSPGLLFSRNFDFWNKFKPSSMSLALFLPRIYPYDEVWTRRSCSYIANILLGRRPCISASRNCKPVCVVLRSFETIFIFSILHD